jgi:hypothetical protein
MLRYARLTTLLAALVSALVFYGSAAGSAPAGGKGPVAHAARGCNVSGRERTFGATYVTSIDVSGSATCGLGAAVVRHYNACRMSNGGAGGGCGGVNGFGCTERRFNVIPTSYDSHVRCNRGHAHIRFAYSQNT